VVATPSSASHAIAADCAIGSARPCTEYAKKDSGASYTRLGARRVPAAALRGCANAGSPAPVRITCAAAKSSSVMKTSPRTSIVTGSRSRPGRPAARRAWVVTSSPARPSPRVATKVRTPSVYRAAMANPSIFGSTVYPATGRPRIRSSRAAHLLSSSEPKTLSRLSIGSLCTMSPTTPPPAPTAPVGESAAFHCGRAASVAATRAISPS
jgi:hypothetical protein